MASLMLSLASHLVHQVPGAQELCPDGPLPLEAHVRLPSVGAHAARHRPTTGGRASTAASSVVN